MVGEMSIKTRTWNDRIGVADVARFGSRLPLDPRNAFLDEVLKTSIVAPSQLCHLLRVHFGTMDAIVKAKRKGLMYYRNGVVDVM